jgi:hypothetical protein
MPMPGASGSTRVQTSAEPCTQMVLLRVSHPLDVGHGPPNVLLVLQKVQIVSQH